MANKPKYISDLEGRMDTLEKNQDEILVKTDQIHIALIGTEYDKANQSGGKGGGIVKRLGLVEKCVGTLEQWKVKISTINAIVYIVGGAAITAVWSIVLIKLKGMP